ncbi:MAG: polymer-forming cytoskeletal protein [Pseudomonadota bacterium]
MAERKTRRFLDSSPSAETTLLSSSMRFTGDFHGDGDFIVTGIVEGNCQVNGTLTLTVQGKWIGTIQARQMIIAGTVVGNVLSSGQLEIASSANIQGDVSGATIAVAQGAVIEGTMKVHSGEDAKSFDEKRKSD